LWTTTRMCLIVPPNTVSLTVESANEALSLDFTLDKIPLPVQFESSDR
jgi:hypothetical protein